MIRKLLAFVVGVALSSPVLADSIDNPAFQSWAKAKKGTAVTHKTTSEFTGQKSAAMTTSTLTELTADTATVDVVIVSKFGGQEVKNPPFKMEIKKTVELPAGKKKEDVAKPEGLVEQGEETLKIGGVEYKTKWHKVKLSQNGTEVESKTWMCEELPGQMVKMEAKTTKPMETTTVMELIEVKKP